MDGTVTITAIMEPFKMIFFIESLPVLLSLDNNEFSKNGNKNQRYFIFGQTQIELLGKL